MSFEEDFLAHYGKKGMRWGQRGSTKDNSGNSKNKEPFVERHKKGIKTGFKVAGAASAAALIATSIHKNKVKNVNAFLLNQYNNPAANPRNAEFARQVLSTNLKLKHLRNTGQITRTQKAISSKVLLNRTFKTIQKIPKY